MTTIAVTVRVTVRFIRFSPLHRFVLLPQISLFSFNDFYDEIYDFVE